MIFSASVPPDSIGVFHPKGNFWNVNTVDRFLNLKFGRRETSFHIFTLLDEFLLAEEPRGL